jgi:hypothetical protein
MFQSIVKPTIPVHIGSNYGALNIIPNNVPVELVAARAFAIVKMSTSAPIALGMMEPL